METDRDVLQNVVFHCETCDYKCSKKQHMDQHKNTIKHKTLIGNQTETQNSTNDICSDCGKKYKNRSGLWKHMKICNVKSNENETVVLSNIVKELLAHTKELTKQNSESQHLNQELMKQSQELIKQTIENEAGKDRTGQDGHGMGQDGHGWDGMARDGHGMMARDGHGRTQTG